MKFYWGFLFILIAAGTYAEDSPQPYINRLKEGLESGGASDSQTSESYTEREKRKLEEQKTSSQIEQGKYIEHLKQYDSPEKTSETTGSYLEQEKAKLLEEKSKKATGSEEGAIAKAKTGRSKLEPQKEGKIRNALGFRLGASTNRTLTTDSARSFETVYGNSWTADLQTFYEFQPFHSEWFGNIGFFIQGGLSYNEGSGAFTRQIPLPNGQAGTFDTASRTRFNFFTLPLSVGADYRFNLLRILRPFVMVGPSLIGYIESRNDEASGNRGFSKGYYFSVGTSLMLDWLMSESSWDLYAMHEVKHYYLALEYARLATLSGDVNFSINGFYLGIIYEY